MTTNDVEQSFSSNTAAENNSHTTSIIL